MRILHIIPSIDPKNGGPIEYARVMADAHQRSGHEVVFLTTDAPDAQAVQVFEFEHLAAGPARPRPLAARRLKRAIGALTTQVDVAVIHGLWHISNMVGMGPLQRAGIPWVIFTHGMLDPYFRKLSPRKNAYKQLAWSIAQGRALSGAHAVLFTCEEEKRLAQNAFWGHQKYQSRVVAFCASDLAQADFDAALGRREFRQLIPEIGERDYLLYLSRIHPKKACDNLIKAFANIASLDPDLDLVIAGPDQIGWQKDLQHLAQSLGVARRIHWPGMVQGAAKVAAFKEARAFVLPSHQENFGLVVAEALSANTPVLISQQVNIWREVIADGAGLACVDTVDGTTDMLRDFICASPEDLDRMKAATRGCYEKRFSVAAAAQDLEDVLRQAAQRQEDAA